VTPLVAAPGDTNPSDACTGSKTCKLMYMKEKKSKGGEGLQEAG